MEKDRKTAITNAEIDAMTNEELLRLAKTRGKYIDRWTRGFHEDHYCDRVLDVPYFLRRLLQVHPKQFTRILDKLTYPDSAHWSAVALSQGLGVHNLSVMERRIPSGFLDSALLLEVSAVARQVWTDQYPQYCFQETKCHQLVRAMVMRKYWLQKSHGETARLFYQLGWKPLDVMLAWIIGDYTTAGEPIDPDCAAEAAREDPEMAVWLLDPDHYRAYFTDQFHPAYDSVMAQAWATFLYCYCGWTDFAPLAKAQRLALTKALVCHYQWRASDLLAALAAAEQPGVFTSLLWGIYREDHLETAFLLNRDGAASGADGQLVDLSADARVGLAATTELDKKQLALWKKRVKDAGGKPPIRQLSIPAQPLDFDDIGGRNTKHITIYTVSGKWGLDMGDLPGHNRADLLDPLHGYGARIFFDGVSNGPEYNNNDVMIHGAAFYRLEGMPFGDYLPQRAVVSPEELPARFVSMAGAAFKQLAGLK